MTEILKKDVLIRIDASIKDALKQLDKSAEKVLLVTDDKNRLTGSLTDGDIRRYLLTGQSLDNDIRQVCNRDPIFITKAKQSTNLVKEMLGRNKIELLPILDDDRKVVDFVTWSEVFYGEFESEPPPPRNLGIPAVIMAGGKGTRLEPFSKIFPKPLIPIGDKPIIEIIIDELHKQGITDYYLTLNYKGEMIKSYMDTLDNGYNISYIWEKDFLDTAGSLKLLQKDIADSFVVSNCDIVVKVDLKDVLALHRQENALLTIVSSVQYHKIPYGVIKFKDHGRVTEICEKPEYAFTINTGLYILEKETLDIIPSNRPFDMVSIIKHLLNNKQRVLTYPVNESDYIDMGQWQEYKNAVEKLRLLS